MTWITWRRYRVRIILLAVYVLAVVVFMVLTERGYQSAIHAFHGTPPQQRALLAAKGDGTYVDVAISALPLLIGLVLGAPVVASELDAKTNRLAWFQGTTRTTWLLNTWMTLATATLALMTVLAFICQWWAAHTVTIAGLAGTFIEPMQMTITGVAPIALALFSLTLGMFVGVAIRRYLSPYATSGFLLLGVMTVMPTEVLGKLAPAIAVPQGLAGAVASPEANSWYLSTGWRRVPGFHIGTHTPSVAASLKICNRPLTYQPYTKCLSTHGLQAVNYYQPESHYWTLQLREAGIYVALAGALLGLSVWLVRRWRA